MAEARAEGLVIASTNVPLGIGGNFSPQGRSVYPDDQGSTFPTGLRVQGAINSDHDGTLEVYFANRVADLAVLPPVGAALGNTVLVSTALVGGGEGQTIDMPALGPFVRVHYLNGAAAQTSFYLWLATVAT